MKYDLAISYADLRVNRSAQMSPRTTSDSTTHQQMAVLGAAVTTLALIPRKKPFAPSLLAMILAASIRPLAFRISTSAPFPRVCKSVLITSKGVVAAAASPPASPPAVQCVTGSYPSRRLMSLDSDSYAVNCSAVKGTVMARVVG